MHQISKNTKYQRCSYAENYGSINRFEELEQTSTTAGNAVLLPLKMCVYHMNSKNEFFRCDFFLSVQMFIYCSQNIISLS